MDCRATSRHERLASQFICSWSVLLPAPPLYAQSIGLSSSANGLVISAPALAMLALNLPFGQAADSLTETAHGGECVMAAADVETAVRGA